MGDEDDGGGRWSSSNSNDNNDSSDNNNNNNNDDTIGSALPAPIIRILHRDLVSTFPGTKNLPRDFWDVKILGLVDRWYVTASYDKGVLGLHSMLTALTSTVVEALARGRLAGLEGRKDEDEDENEDEHEDNRRRCRVDGSDTAKSLRAAWEEVRQQMVYGGLIDELFDALPRTENIAEHSPDVKAAVEYCCIQ